jgi:hypothetical protein
MARQKAIDWSTKSHERKEYLTFNCEWYGYDYYGAEIKLGKTHEEGKFMEQTKKLVNEIDQATGRRCLYALHNSIQ